MVHSRKGSGARNVRASAAPLAEAETALEEMKDRPKSIAGVQERQFFEQKALVHLQEVW